MFHLSVGNKTKHKYIRLSLSIKCSSIRCCFFSTVPPNLYNHPSGMWVRLGASVRVVPLTSVSFNIWCSAQCHLKSWLESKQSRVSFGHYLVPVTNSKLVRLRKQQRPTSKQFLQFHSHPVNSQQIRVMFTGTTDMCLWNVHLTLRFLVPRENLLKHMRCVAKKKCPCCPFMVLVDDLINSGLLVSWTGNNVLVIHRYVTA